MCVCLQCVFNHDGSKFAAVGYNRIYIFNIRDTYQKMDLRGHYKQVSTFHSSSVCGSVGVSVNPAVGNYVFIYLFFT